VEKKTPRESGGSVKKKKPRAYEDMIRKGTPYQKEHRECPGKGRGTPGENDHGASAKQGNLDDTSAYAKTPGQNPEEEKTLKSGGTQVGYTREASCRT